jgi:acyl-CoA thioesterase-1
MVSEGMSIAMGLGRLAKADRGGRIVWTFRPYGPSGRYFNALRRAACAIVILSVLVPAVAADAAQRTIVAFGDSLTAGYGLPPADGFATRLGAALTAAGVGARVINAGVSGDTTAGGLARVDWLLADKPDLVIVELGANDALRGFDPGETRRNLNAIIERIQSAGARVLLAGMRAPPNLGREYAEEFNRIFPDLAKRHKVPLYPFFLDGVAAVPQLNQADGIHPNAKGVAVIVERIMPKLLRALGVPG